MQISGTLTAGTPSMNISDSKGGGGNGNEHGNGGLPLWAVIVIYSALFYGAWILFELISKPLINSLGANAVLMQLLKSGVIKNLIWTLPALLLVKKYEPHMQVGLNEMFTSKVDMRTVFAVLLSCTAIVMIPKLAKGGLEINKEFTVCTAIGFLFVGITEESVFRGWLLNATAGDTSRSRLKAYLLNAVMFTLIHFPIWYMDGRLPSILSSFGFLSIMAVGFIFGVLFLDTKNLLIPVMLHMYYDVLVTVFV